MKKINIIKNYLGKNLIRNFCKNPETEPLIQKTDFIEA